MTDSQNLERNVAALSLMTFAIVGMHSSNFIAQTTMSPLLGLLLSGYGYATVYPLVGAIWIVLALLVLRTGMRMVRHVEIGAPAIASSTAS